MYICVLHDIALAESDPFVRLCFFGGQYIKDQMLHWVECTVQMLNVTPIFQLIYSPAAELVRVPFTCFDKYVRHDGNIFVSCVLMCVFASVLFIPLLFRCQNLTFYSCLCVLCVPRGRFYAVLPINQTLVDNLLSAVSFLDMLLQFRTAYVDNKTKIITSPKKVTREYW